MNISTAALGGSNTARPAPAAGKHQSLQKWKHQVKIMTTRITVIRRFGKKYSTKNLQCSIAPGLTAGSSQIISQVQELIEKSNSSEGSAKKNQPAGRRFSKVSSSVPTSGAQFSPQRSPSQDEPHQKVKRNPILETKNGEGFFTDHRALAPAWQILLVLFGFPILKEADLLDVSTAGLLVIATVIVLPPGMEGTTTTNDRIMRVNFRTVQLVLLLSFSFMIKGVHAQGDSEDGEPEHPNQLDKLPYNVKAAAGTFLAGLMMIVAVVVAGNINRRRLVTGTQATVSADPTVSVPAAASNALPPLAGALPAVPALAAANPAAMVPVPAAAHLALPPLAGALPVVPPLAVAPAAAIVAVPAAAPLALPPLAGAHPVVPPLAVAPAAIVPVPAAAPLAAPPAAPAGRFDIMGGLLDNLDAQFLVIYNPL